MVRLFFALDLPEALRLRIGALEGGIDRARWVPPESLHITLRFIGEVDEPTMQDVAFAAAAVRFEPIEVTLSGAGHFESRDRVRALWIGVEANPGLALLRDRIDAAVMRAGLPAERRKFKPHVTVARLPGARPGAVHPWLAANTMFRAMPFRAERFVLYSSHLGRNGSIYRPECSFPHEDWTAGPEEDDPFAE